MVKLILNDSNQVSMVELALINSGIKYEVDIAEIEYGITPPCLIVDGVPLDLEHALKWIGERNNG